MNSDYFFIFVNNTLIAWHFLTPNDNIYLENVAVTLLKKQVNYPDGVWITSSFRTIAFII